CGNRDIRQEMIGPGAEVTFGIRSDLDQVKQGQPFRVVVYSDGQFKSGVASNSLVLAPRYANNP
ncbi:MAG TPA: hypothetical protein VGE76_02335, partial [Opitutaceae bacterium]